MEVVALEVRIGAQYLALGHAVRDHADDGRHWNAQGANARHAAHLAGIEGYARELQCWLRGGCHAQNYHKAMIRCGRARKAVPRKCIVTKQ